MAVPTNGKDVLVLGDGDDTLDTLGGNDIVYAGLGRNIIHGGAGDDKLYGQGGWDALYGDDGKDYIQGGSGPGELFGGAGSDEIHAGAGSGQDLYGDDGNDKLYGDDTANEIWGGTGKDLLEGGGGDDRLNGEAGNDKLYGGDGNDRLVGEDGNDKLNGGDGSDFLIGLAGKDELDGGDGVDYAFYLGNLADYVITTSASGVTTINDTRDGARSDDTDKLVNVERLQFADQLVILSSHDPDGTFAGAVAVTPGDFSGGQYNTTAQFAFRDDVDIWSVHLSAGQTVTGNVVPQGDYPEPLLAVFGPSGQLLATDGHYDGAHVTITAATTGLYYFAASDAPNMPLGDGDLATGPDYSNGGNNNIGGDYAFSLVL